MKRTILLTLFMALLLALPATAQDHKNGKKEKGDWHKEFVDLKVKFLIQELDLKDEAKQKFSEIYTKMENEKGVEFRKAKAAERAVKKNPNATEAQYEAAANAMADYKTKELEIEKKYNSQLRKVLTSKQMYELKKAERKFQEKLMQMKKDRKDKEKK